ncbi:sugar ABC transporter [Agrobacterium sp. TS43]|jgi:multiple sugar transport system ATP-binding protein|uniref:ABC transporter ATP-binding protein n=1 Tax=Agrobacterium TaxID=357 RepID=UPI0004A0CF60|nr:MULTISPECIES: ABC transporter ATP-binding protein [Agrobacterium]KDR88402.1 sugar ABC transporter [Agrobacterium tumefaciens GW4]KVK52132.1 sugar ABC transporter [Agrobacterium sp. JL28]KVK53275.1 sugar ABC transporter [Agrobacterium sp. LY4]KVK64474.1 sugar ABC transporter [Agrobacterium sp. TS45]KVK65373.1 sugar ABC transporter [Agrobacterium sp. TS43]
MASITLKSVSKSFGAKDVIRNIDIAVSDGEFLVLLGPSGCGKSTLLRMLAGLESISGGEILIGSRRVDNLPPSDRDMAFVFQSYALYPHLTVRRNMTFPLVMKQFRWWHHLPIIGGLVRRRIENSPQVKEMVQRNAKILGLTEMLDRFPRTLSGGQRQRVALGRAMVRQPEVFLMDEPLSNLDAKLRTSMRAEISKLHADIGGTFVYVTHDQVEAMTMGTKIALMRDGVVQQFGSSREIYSDPANTYVARFIGTPPMNLIEADAASGVVSVGGIALALPQGLSAAVREDGKVLFGIRPNAIRLTPERQPGSVEGTVTLVEHIGAESVIAVTLSNARTAHREEGELDAVMVTEQGYTGLKVGDPVSLAFNLDDAVLFSAETGLRLRA